MIKWFKKLFQIVKNYDEFVDDTKYFEEFQRNMNDNFGITISELQKIIRERTDIHADIHMRDCSYVVMVGRFKNRDYVEIFNMKNRNFEDMLSRLKEMKRYGEIGRVDAVPHLSAVIEDELKWI